MNWILDDVHDCRYSYGFILFPTWNRDRWGKFKWIGLFKGRLALTDGNGFHNCTLLGY